MHIVLYPLPVLAFLLKGEMKFKKNWVGEQFFKKICMGKQKGEGRRNGLFQGEKNKGGWGYGISRGIEEI